jgi:hypothetical protein
MVNLHLLAVLTVKVSTTAAALVVRRLVAALLVFRFRQVRQRVHLMGHHHHHLTLRLSQVTRRLFVPNDHGDHNRNKRNNHNRHGTQAAHKAAQGHRQRLLAPVVTPAKSAAYRPRQGVALVCVIPVTNWWRVGRVN